MFVKNRALARDYVGKRVASDLVDMHDGALSAYNTSSYALMLLLSTHFNAILFVSQTAY